MKSFVLPLSIATFLAWGCCFLIPQVTKAQLINEVEFSAAAPPPPFAPEILTILTMLPHVDKELAKHETPVMIRLAQFLCALWWNCVAVYSEDYKDGITKTTPSVKVLDSAKWTTPNRSVCAAQATASYVSLSFPGNLDALVDALAGIGVTVAPKLDAAIASCNSVLCLQNVATSSSYDPNTMGHIVAKQIYDYSLKDGFNQLGRDAGCTVNCRSYSDVTGYQPVSASCDRQDVFGNNIDRWEPLLEDNGKGYFIVQEHVAPHIGKTAKFRNLPKSDRVNRVAPVPRYSKSRAPEALAAIRAMSTLDDVTKIEVEVFDDKLKVANAVAKAFLDNLIAQNYQDTSSLAAPGVIVSFERFMHFLNGYLAAEYDSIIISWKEKVHHDLIRPTSVIKRWGNKRITTWAAGVGVKTFPAREFEAYMRVMPHSEYVSGTSCLFQASQEYIEGYMAHIGLDPAFPMSFLPYPPGSSKIEPGLTPATTVTLQYSSFALMAEVGSQSRINGGIHFEKSVSAGKQLCTGIGDASVAVAVTLYD